jgi:hypothetical protein
MKYFVLISILGFLVSCNDRPEKNRVCSINIVDSVNSSRLIHIYSNRTDARISYNNKKYDLPFPNIYNYQLADRFVDGGDVYLVRKKWGRDIVEKYQLLKMNLNNNQFEDSLYLENEYSNLYGIGFSCYLNNNKTRILAQFKYSVKNSEVAVYNRNEKESRNYIFHKNIDIYENSWLKEKLLCNDRNKTIYIIDTKSFKIDSLAIKGDMIMWLDDNHISYIDEKTLFVYNLKDHKKQKIYKSRDGILNEKNIRKYYWFNDQKKFLIFERRNNKLIGNKIFNEKNIIIEYKCF